MRVSKQGDWLGSAVTQEPEVVTCSLLDQQQSAIIMEDFTSIRGFHNSVIAIFSSFNPYMGRVNLYGEGYTPRSTVIATYKGKQNFPHVDVNVF